jgi:hypothetical protein
MTTVTLADGTQSNVDGMNDAVVVHGVDESGAYIGLVDAGDAFEVVPGPPPAADWFWSFVESMWLYQIPLAKAKAAALVAIDSDAGAARARYITDVTGQQAVYIRKLEQAKAFLLDTEQPVPPYIAGEAAALGVSPATLATQIVGIASYWDDTLSPAIEATRIGAKRAVDDAVTVAAVTQIVDTARATFNGY